MAKNSSNIPPEVRQFIEETAAVTVSRAYTESMGGQVNYFKSTENLLRNYKNLKAIVDNAEQYLAVQLQGKSKSFVIFSENSGYKSDDDKLEEMERAKMLSYQRTKARFDELEQVVQQFYDKKEFTVIRMYYFREDATGAERAEDLPAWTWETIAEALDIDEKTARRWRSKLVNDMAVCIFGKPAAVGAGTHRQHTA